MEITSAGFNCVLCDFGVARLVGDAAPVAGLVVPKSEALTMRYTPPEQFRRLADPKGSNYKLGEIDKAIDVYALAITFFELITGTYFMRGLKAADLIEKILLGERLTFAAEPLLPGMSRAVLQGWSQSSLERPRIAEIVANVKSDLSSLEAKVKSGELSSAIWKLPF